MWLFQTPSPMQALLLLPSLTLSSLPPLLSLFSLYYWAVKQEPCDTTLFIKKYMFYKKYYKADWLPTGICVLALKVVLVFRKHDLYLSKQMLTKNLVRFLILLSPCLSRVCMKESKFCAWGGDIPPFYSWVHLCELNTVILFRIGMDTELYY